MIARKWPRSLHRARAWTPAIGVCIALAGGIWIIARLAHTTAPPAGTAHFANADDVGTVSSGRIVYMRRCASCHGKRLQGQPLWQLRDEYWGRRAPAHDESGHTWEHSDEDLFHVTKYGRFASVAPDVPSFMPAFAGTLTDEQILAATAFIKARWPLSLRVSQSLLNPGNRGMPADASSVDWTFPPTCSTSAQRWRAVSR